MIAIDTLFDFCAYGPGRRGFESCWARQSDQGPTAAVVAPFKDQKCSRAVDMRCTAAVPDERTVCARRRGGLTASKDCPPDLAELLAGLRQALPARSGGTEIFGV